MSERPRKFIGLEGDQIPQLWPNFRHNSRKWVKRAQKNGIKSILGRGCFSSEEKNAKRTFSGTGEGIVTDFFSNGLIFVLDWPKRPGGTRQQCVTLLIIYPEALISESALSKATKENSTPPVLRGKPSLSHRQQPLTNSLRNT
jgi:hypothetical protein